MIVSKAKLLFDLISYVNARRQFTAQDVASEFHISLRTAHRYLAELGEMGVPLYTEPGRSGGYRVLNNRVLPPILFSENEAFAIFFAFQSLKYYHSLPFDVDIASVSRKLYANLPLDTRKKIDRLDAVLSIWNKKRSVPSHCLKEIIEAAIERQVVQIEYMSKAGHSRREVAPIGIYAYDGFWYMPAFDLAREMVRLFRTDRIVKLIRLERTYSPDLTLNDWLLSHTEQEPKAPIRLYVELTEEGLRQCRSQPWLEPYLITNDQGQGSIDTVIDRAEIEFVSRYFFQLGTVARVIEPEEMVSRIRSWSQELLQHYTVTGQTDHA
ncbi:YafY family transcriptional regulator [Brevibacillus composti]|uniref:YafY family transcriptional regulator n=1 Tax=Brevibacillus composti TaxID=2796470 RepID=A0A7T5EPS4_9BACL|nr:YafY family transcriptional regulator [Brevibacillus composti]QUO43607.1 YafY family transcriptional regulator [Brevibacillus composti]